MIKITNQEIIETIKYLNFCGLCTTGDCKNCARKIVKDKVLKLLKGDKEKLQMCGYNDYRILRRIKQ